jgi:DNA processing protein
MSVAAGGSVEDLTLALAAFAGPRTPSRMHQLLRAEGKDGLRRVFQAMHDQTQRELQDEAQRLAAKDIRVVFSGEQGYPHQLGDLAASSPIMFFWGDEGLFAADSIGMCGSRHASDTGIKAATACGEVAGALGVTVVSGYAKGVDTATHLAALRHGGTTVIVLAEGFDHFRVKQSFPPELFRSDNVLVVSQFHPRQRWTASAAMTRNRIIFGLGMALVVVEAGDRGGTLAAGEGALKAARPVLVLDFDGATPAGNRQLLEHGGTPVDSRRMLDAEIRRIRSQHRPPREQLSLL